MSVDWNWVQGLLSIVSGIGAHPDDSDEVRLEKTLLVALALMISPLAVLWGVIYLVFGERTAASIPLTYATVSWFSIAVFYETRSYDFFRFSQLVLMLVLPFLLMVALGGFINSSAVILWALLSPLGALVFEGRRAAVRWFLAYLALVAVSGLLQRYVRLDNNLTPGLVQIFFVMNIGAVSTVAFVALHIFVGGKDSAFNRLRREQVKSEDLLHNMLPQEVAEILKNQDGLVAKHYDEASILFADIVGFTPLSVELDPAEAVELLNEMYSHFDSLVEQYGLEKIRTVGDNYMVASGVPNPRSEHAQAIAHMALDMQAYVVRHPMVAGRPLKLRIGINSGLLVAGVIGRKKFQYDLWGDVVNTASRMESHGQGGKIQVTADTFELLKDEFVFEPRGTLDVKGKGEMETWFLSGWRGDCGDES